MKWGKWVLLVLSLAAHAFVAAAQSSNGGGSPRGGMWDLDENARVSVIAGDGLELSVRAVARPRLSVDMEVPPNCPPAVTFLGGRANAVLRLQAHAGARSKSCAGRATIGMPSGVALQLRARGPVSLSGMTGDLRGATDRGSIRLDALRGTVDLSTGDGDVTVTNSPARGRVRTDRGRVTIRGSKDLEGFSASDSVVYEVGPGRAPRPSRG